jgi:hypothetical protein
MRLFLLLSLLQLPGCSAADKVAPDESSKSHPNCKLYGHFYAPKWIISTPASSPYRGYSSHDWMASYQKETISFALGLRVKVGSFGDLKTSKSLSDLKDVAEFVHGDSQHISGIDIDF